MQYISYYNSSIGKILIAADEKALIGLWFENQKYYASVLNKNAIKKEIQIIKDTKLWLDKYFKKEKTNVFPNINLIGTPFQLSVWKLLREIPYGQLTTYGSIAKQLALNEGKNQMSAQAVGSAISHNPIAIIVPCHRVIGRNNSLTGYAGGIDKKIQLLKTENIDTTNLTLP